MSISNLKALIFDMDGLMIDSESITYDIWKIKFDELGLPLDRAYYSTVCGHSSIEVIEMLKEHYGSEYPFDRILYDALDYMSTIPIPIKPGLTELLKYATDHGLRLAIASGSSRNIVENDLKNDDLLKYFEIITCGDEVTHSKPDPEIYLKTLDKLRLSADECLVLEDAPGGIIASHRAGIPVVAVPDMRVPDPDVLALCAGVFEDLSQVIALISHR